MPLTLRDLIEELEDLAKHYGSDQIEVVSVDDEDKTEYTPVISAGPLTIGGDVKVRIT